MFITGPASGAVARRNIGSTAARHAFPGLCKTAQEMADLATTSSRIIGMVSDPGATLAQNSQPVPPWHLVAREHVLPLIVVTAVVNSLLMWLLRPMHEAIVRQAGLEMPETGNPLFTLALRIATQFAGIFVWALIVGFFAGTLGGRNDFNAAYVLVSLALTPYILAAALVPIPYIGLMLFLCGLVYALIIMYRGIPALIGVPDENRAKHLALSLVSMVLAGLGVALLLGPLVSPQGS